ncbi:endonuclease/exonuclease/phosphatase family protein [Maribacter sp. 2304DJ31-5]|uniref:endonuclease/exonuclease/phosphatase family protein n=1 Tax=Maribacter sp. 2304DJ31-5 TaxID=3386273 RepID=UPI0039BD6E46
MRFSLFKKKKNKQLYTVAFYNLENLFDTRDDDYTLDDDFTPGGFKKWTPKRYERKLAKLARTIYAIGRDNNPHAPILVGVAEVENSTVLNDLLNTKPLEHVDYGFVHYQSPDERGIDTALIYHRKYFKVISSEPIPLLIDNTDGARDTTRDILYVHGALNGEEVHLFVNHWPSRRDGGQLTEYKRLKAAEVVKQKMLAIAALNQDPNYIVMGDFNDDPSSLSIQTLIEGTGLYNPMEKLHSPKERGSSHYKRNWSLFDQIILSHSFFNYKKGSHSFDKANIYDDRSLKEFAGKYKGNPYRTYAGKKYLGGYSDHFPVYILLKYNV